MFVRRFVSSQEWNNNNVSISILNTLQITFFSSSLLVITLNVIGQCFTRIFISDKTVLNFGNIEIGEMKVYNLQVMSEYSLNYKADWTGSGESSSACAAMAWVGQVSNLIF